MSESKKEKLIKRSITAILFGSVSLFLLYWSFNTNILFVALVCLLCYRELFLLDPRNKPLDQDRFNLGMTTAINIIYAVFFFAFGYYNEGFSLFWQILIYISLLYGLLTIINLFRDVPFFDFKVHLSKHCGFIVLHPMLLALYCMNVHESSTYFLLKCVVLIWIADSMAYLVGSFFGKTKLLPSISPNKTWEGALGGMSFTILAGMGIAKISQESLFFWTVLAFIIFVFGLFGDLGISKLKRTLGVKDTGNLLPGHGGFLDRFDAFLFIWPFVAFILTFIQP